MADATSPLTEDEIRASTVGELTRHASPIHLVDYDRSWPRRFCARASESGGALGERVLLLDHVGSTLRAGLAAKPVLDMTLVVADS